MSDKNDLSPEALAGSIAAASPSPGEPPSFDDFFNDAINNSCLDTVERDAEELVAGLLAEEESSLDEDAPFSQHEKELLFEMAVEKITRSFEPPEPYETCGDYHRRLAEEETRQMKARGIEPGETVRQIMAIYAAPEGEEADLK